MSTRSRQRCSGCSGTRPGADSRAAARRRAERRHAPGRARARLGRDVSAPLRPPANRPRRVAAGRHERLLPRRRRARLRSTRRGSRHCRASTLEAAGDAARARGRVTGALLLGGLAALALGGLLAAPRRTFQTGLTVQACGAAAVCVAGFLVLERARRSDRGSRASSHRVWCRRVERAVPGRARAGCGSSACLLPRLPRGGRARADGRRAHRATRPRPGRSVLRPRSADLPDGLGADDARAGDRDPGRAQRRPGGAQDRLRLPRRDASRRCGNLDRDPAPRAGRGDRRPGRDQLGIGPADRDRADGAGRDGDEGRGDAVSCLAAARASDRARAGVGADERRDDQGRDLCAGQGSRRLARCAAGLVRGARARARCALRRRRRRLRALPARAETAPRVPFGREHRDHRARARRLPCAARARRRPLGLVRARGRAAPHAEPRRLQVAALPRRRSIRAGRRVARARPARRVAPAHAVDRRCVPRRRDGDRRPATAERLRVGMADPAGVAARPGLRWSRRRDGRRDRARRAGRDRGARRLLLRQGRRARAARAAEGESRCLRP